MLIRLIVGIMLLIAAILFMVWKLMPGPEPRDVSLGLPETALTATVRDGGMVFQQDCAHCHGANLRGTDAGPPLVHPYYRPEHHSDLAFYLAIKDGVKQHHWNFGDMPPAPQVAPDQIPHIIAYVRAVQREAGLID